MYFPECSLQTTEALIRQCTQHRIITSTSLSFTHSFPYWIKITYRVSTKQQPAENCKTHTAIQWAQLPEPMCQQQRGAGIQTHTCVHSPTFQTVAHRKNFLSKHKGFGEGNCRMFHKCLPLPEAVCVRSKTGLSLQWPSLHDQRNYPLYTLPQDSVNSTVSVGCLYPRIEAPRCPMHLCWPVHKQKNSLSKKSWEASKKDVTARWFLPIVSQ